jgi:excisionase family DNA binding protein
VTTDGDSSWHDDDMLTVTDAARIAQRSARTIRRAYGSGRLVAHRDGNGRGVRIHYGDLRAWLLAELIAPRSEPVFSELIARVDLTGSRAGENTGNLELLTAVRRRSARRARASATAQPPRSNAGSGNA